MLSEMIACSIAEHCLVVWNKDATFNKFRLRLFSCGGRGEGENNWQFQAAFQMKNLYGYEILEAPVIAKYLCVYAEALNDVPL
jgi:hypothetical protein